MRDDEEMVVRCFRCGGVATVNPTTASDCTCVFGSCTQDGLPYATATQQALRACAECESRHTEEDARPNRRRTVEVTPVVTLEACRGAL